MEKMFRVPLKYGGYKYFTGDDAEKEANAYEVEMKQKEIEEKERQRKAEEERRILNEQKDKRLLEINNKVKEVNELLKKYYGDYDTPLAREINVNESRTFSDLLDKLWAYYFKE